MTAKQYRDALDSLELSQMDAAKFFGVAPRSSRRWALDEARIPEAVAKALRYMVEHKLTPDEFSPNWFKKRRTN